MLLENMDTRAASLKNNFFNLNPEHPEKKKLPLPGKFTQYISVYHDSLSSEFTNTYQVFSFQFSIAVISAVLILYTSPLCPVVITDVSELAVNSRRAHGDGSSVELWHLALEHLGDYGKAYLLKAPRWEKRDSFLTHEASCVAHCWERFCSQTW